MNLSPVWLPIDLITTDPDTQPRVKTSLKVAAAYAEAMASGSTFPPVTVFNDGKTYWLAHGYYRYQACKIIGAEQILALAIAGTKRDAMLYAVGANETEGLPRSNADKRRSVALLLSDREWCQWSDREIARRCGVHRNLVGKLRSSLSKKDSERIYKTKHGTVARMDATNIGRRYLIGQRVVISLEHPLLGGRSATICQSPHRGEVMVELDDGRREAVKITSLKSELAHQLQLKEGGLVEIASSGNERLDGRLGKIEAIKGSKALVWVRNVDKMIMESHKIDIKRLEPISEASEPKMAEIETRLSKLRAIALDPMDAEILNILERAIVFTPREVEYLNAIEEHYSRMAQLSSKRED